MYFSVAQVVDSRIRTLENSRRALDILIDSSEKMVSLYSEMLGGLIGSSGRLREHGVPAVGVGRTDSVQELLLADRVTALVSEQIDIVIDAHGELVRVAEDQFYASNQLARFMIGKLSAMAPPEVALELGSLESVMSVEEALVDEFAEAATRMHATLGRSIVGSIEGHCASADKN